VNAYLGGGMTSKLYQSIRENKALVYSVYSYLHSMTDSGLLMVYAGTSNDNLSKVLLEINEEFKKLKDNGLTLKDVEYFKKQVKGQIIMGSDDVDNRMNSIAINEMVFAKYKTVDEVISEIDTVSVESIKNYLDSFFDLKKISGIIIGSLEKEESTKIYKQVFKD
jgi:predicted Zn-dependent peptidase